MYDILIAGGGPVGLGLAIELGQRRIRVAVVERHENLHRIPKGQNLTQRTMEHMRIWGVEDEIRAAKTIPHGVGLGGLTAYGTLFSGIHYDWFRRADVSAFYGVENERLPQYATEAVLRKRVAKLDTVETFFGWTAQGIAKGDDGVALDIVRGDESKRIGGRYLVGCDGAKSMVRTAAGITETRRDHDRQMVLIVFRSPEFFEALQQFPDKQFYNVLDPALDGYWKFFGMVDWGTSFFFHAPVPPGTNRRNFDFAGFIRQAAGADFPVELDYVGFWDLRITLAETYRAGRVFIAGDAAHSHPPYGGYGVNTGLEDARNLGWKLAAVVQGWGGPHLLESYDAERRPVFASTVSEFIERFINTDREFLRANDPQRDPAAFEAAWLARAADTKAQGISTFAPHYTGSPIIVGGAQGQPSAVGIHDFKARPGHHLPPLPLRQGSTIDALGPGFTLIGAADDAFQSAAGNTPFTTIANAPVEVLETYGAPRVLVRPDGFVAWSGHDPTMAAAVMSQAAGW